MDELLTRWQPLLLWASAGSLLTLLMTAAAVPWVVTRLPADYFARPRRTAWKAGQGIAPLKALVGVLKNLLGAILLCVGLVMLVTPGQGVLTILAGLLLMNFPGKYRVERWLVMRPGVMRALNWLRARRGQTPFEIPGNVGG